MAYAVLSSVTQTMDQILNHNQYPVSVDGKHKISSLRQQVIFLREFLEKSPQEAESLETRISDAANEVEDVIEHFMYEETRCRHRSIATAALYDFRGLEMVMEEINSIAQEVQGMMIVDSPMTMSASNSSPASAPADDVTVGLEEDVMKIKDMVCQDSTKLHIIPITGMGGIGKTTLAKAVYHDQAVMEGFKARAWITVSQDCKTENIFANLLDSLQKTVGEENEVKSSDSTAERVYRILYVNKYLVVVDDLWSEKAWNDLKIAFPDTGNGSRIVITTRIESVASLVDSSSFLHKMRFMDPDQSWNLLRQKVFAKRDCLSDLENIGKDIATICGGLPLAIVLVAGILSTVNETPLSWEKVAKKVSLSVDKEEGHFEEIITLSYTHLPQYLRPCFLYMGGFPEDYEIRASKLVKLWIAEGFVKTRHGRSLEEEAEEYLKDLVRRSLALAASTKSDGRIKSCSVHDMIRELCKRKALDENYERRLSIAHPDLTRLARPYGSTLRSVLSFQPNESSLGGLRKFKLLRVLDVVDTDAYSLPASVFELFHLRYLAFGCPMEIPAAISRLQNLRALIIRPSKRLRHHSKDELYLPFEIWSMPLLTHLTSFFDILPNPEGLASPMENLLTLAVVKKLTCTEEMMEMIPNVKKLGITYFGEKYNEDDDYQLNNLVLLRRLEKLSLVMKAESRVQLRVNPVFPKTLRKLSLSGWRLPWSYLEVAVGSLPDLRVLKLTSHACEGEKWETSRLQFPSLEFLHIDGSDLKEWVTEMSHLPRLKRLVIYRCPSLSEIPEEIGEITALELIEADYANDSLVECVKQIREDQMEAGNPSLQVRRVHYKGS